MIICLQTRLGEIHIIGWTNSRGIHHTVCGKSFSHYNLVETFAVDNIFSDMCGHCWSYQDLENIAIANDDARQIKCNPSRENSLYLYNGIQRGWDSTRELFEGTLDRRLYPKRHRMRRKFPSDEAHFIRRYKLHG